MVFNSLTFFVFIAVVLALHRGPFSWTLKKLLLTVASYLFYAAWSPPFVILLWLSTAVDWVVAGRMAAAENPRRRKLLLALSLTSNLGILSLFKYGNFLTENFGAALQLAGLEHQPPALDIILPVGISFYTFQTLSYTLDVYRGKLRPAKSLLDFALFVTFFPQLVAGPIVRAAHFLPQLEEEHKADARQLSWGAALLLIGLTQKVVLGDAILAPAVDAVYGETAAAGAADAWAGTLAFSLQILLDFSGYSLCAIGVAMMLGFVLPDNFQFPYAAIGFSDFWRRWHISLSTWLRDYLYISLGGNRRGATRTQINLMITMLLGGLWHGASWRFVVWGAMHGAFLVVERQLRNHLGHVALFRTPAMRFCIGLLTFLCVSLAWVFFRADSFADAGAILVSMWGRADMPHDAKALTSPTQRALIYGLLGLVLTSHWLLRRRSLEAVWLKLPHGVKAVCLAIMMLALALSPGDDRAFIYFQF